MADLEKPLSRSSARGLMFTFAAVLAYLNLLGSSLRAESLSFLPDSDLAGR